MWVIRDAGALAEVFLGRKAWYWLGDALVKNGGVGDGECGCCWRSGQVQFKEASDVDSDRTAPQPWRQEQGENVTNWEHLDMTRGACTSRSHPTHARPFLDPKPPIVSTTFICLSLSKVYRVGSPPRQHQLPFVPPNMSTPPLLGH